MFCRLIPEASTNLAQHCGNVRNDKLQPPNGLLKSGVSKARGNNENVKKKHRTFHLREKDREKCRTGNTAYKIRILTRQTMGIYI